MSKHDTATPTPRGFARADDEGLYLRCAAFHIDEDDVGRACGGKQRLTDDGERWVCEDCGASTRELGTDGGGA